MGPVRIASIALVVLVALATGLSAQEIHRWKTPDGRIFFGDEPPEGSVDLGVVGGSVGAEPGDVVLTDEDLTEPTPAADPGTTPAEPSAEDEARRIALASAVSIVGSSVSESDNEWKIAGSVQNSGPETVHDVEVGSAGTWKATDPRDVPPGEFAVFVFVVPAEPGSSPPAVEVRWAEQTTP